MRIYNFAEEIGGGGPQEDIGITPAGQATGTLLVIPDEDVTSFQFDIEVKALPDDPWVNYLTISEQAVAVHEDIVLLPFMRLNAQYVKDGSLTVRMVV